MYCSNCGKEATDNFCSSCGASLRKENADNEAFNFEGGSEETEVRDTFITVNNTEVNISEIISVCGKNKIEAIKILRAQTGVGLNEGKSIIDKVYKDVLTREPKKSFWQKAKEESERQQIQAFEKKKSDKERLEQLKRERVAYCPKCYSTSLSAHKKGFGIGKAVIGAAIAGPIGLIGGNINAKKVRVTCLKCGHQFWSNK